MKKYFLHIFILIFLSLHFQFNILNISPNKFFYDFQTDSEYFLLGRLHLTSQHGFYSKGSMLGKINSNDKDTIESFLLNKKITIEEYAPYTANNLLQIIFYTPINTFLDSLSPFFTQIINFMDRTDNLYPRKFNLEIMSAINSFLLSFFILRLIKLINLETGRLGGGIILLLLIFSPWLAAIGRNIFWFFWFYFFIIGFIFKNYVLKKPEIKNYKNNFLFFLLFFLLFIKDYIWSSNIILSSLTLILYGAIKFNFKLKEIIFLIINKSYLILLSLILAVNVHLILNSVVFNSYEVGLNDLLGRVGRRLTNPNLLNDENFGLINILKTYLTTSDVLWHKDHPNIINVLNFISFTANDIIIFLVFFLVIFYLFYFKFLNKKNILNFFLLDLIFLLLFLSSISWFIVASKHAFYHQHMSFILWHIYFITLAPIFIIKKFSSVDEKK